MPRGQPLLLPVKGWFVLASLCAALMLSLVLNISLFGSAPWLPDVLAMTLVFWCVHQPHKVGIFMCFFLGLLTDVQASALLGQHALSYSVMGYLAVQFHRRLQWFTGTSQAPQILPVFAIGTLIDVLLRLWFGALSVSVMIVAAPLLQAALWPTLSFVLLMPQRRPPDPDETRPL